MAQPKYEMLDDDTKKVVLDQELSAAEQDHYRTAINLETAPEPDKQAFQDRLDALEAKIDNLKSKREALS